MISREFNKNGTWYNLGVTGSMGCGKTYVCNQLELLARKQLVLLTVFDFDIFRGRVLGQTDNPEYLRVQETLIKEFGAGIRAKEGGINRRTLAEITYSDSNKLSIADKIVDRTIENEIRQRKDGLGGILLIESALLVEKDQYDLVDYNLLVVQCPYDVQIQRLACGDIPLEQIRKRLELQYSNKKKEAEARKAQQCAGRGDLYIFDNSPKGNNLGRLFDQILEKSRGKRSG